MFSVFIVASASVNGRRGANQIRGWDQRTPYIVAMQSILANDGLNYTVH